MGKNHCIPLFLELVDFVDQGEHLFALFATVGAEHYAGLDGAEAVVKFVDCHVNVRDKVSGVKIENDNNFFTSFWKGNALTESICFIHVINKRYGSRSPSAPG